MFADLCIGICGGGSTEIGLIDNQGMTPLLRSAKSGCLVCVKHLLENIRADMHCRDHNGMNAISCAAKYGHANVVDYLFRAGCDVNALDVSGKSPVQLAIAAGHWPVVRYLVGRGADVNTADTCGTTALQQVVDAGQWKMVRYLIGTGADVNVASSETITPLESAMDAGEWDIVKYMVEKGALLSDVIEGKKATLLDFVVGHCDEEYKEFYNVVRVSNVELLDMLIKRKLGDADVDNPDNLGKIEPLLSEAYEALKIRRVPLSTEMEYEVENKIITSRFFAEKNEVDTDSVVTSLEDVKKRMEIVSDVVRELNELYSGDVGLEWDEEFLIHIMYIAQNIRVLKRQLKSTYKKLPWEEMEFCLLMFVSSHINNKLNSVYRLVLNKDNILACLMNFSKEIGVQQSQITKGDVNSKFPPKQYRSSLSSRKDMVKSVIASNPVFKDMYDYYEVCKNVYSLQRIKSYIKLASSINLDGKEVLGKLIIERCLQVIGESLKNTIESPNVSDDIHERLFNLGPRKVREMVLPLRDLLSHSHALTSKIQLEETNDITIFKQIKDDLEKVNVEIIDILHKKKLDMLRIYSDKITTSKSLVEIKKLGKDLDTIVLGEGFAKETSERKELQKLKKLIRDLNEAITDQTDKEKESIKKIGYIIDSQESRITQEKSKFSKAALEIRGLSNRIRFANNDKSIQSIQEMSRHLIYIDKEEPESFADILKLVTGVVEDVKIRVSKESFDKLNEIQNDIVWHTSFEVRRVRGIDEFKTKLDMKESNLRNSIESKISAVFDEVEKTLETEQQISFRKEIDMRQQSYESKKCLITLFKQLKEGTISQDDPVAVKMYEDLVPNLGLNKAKKRSLESHYQKRDWDEAKNIITNLRNNYEIFVYSVKNLIENDKTCDMVHHFKSLFSSIFKTSTLLSKLTENIDHILLENHNELRTFFEKRLGILSQLVAENTVIEFLRMCKEDQELTAAVEVLVLDLTDILDSISLLGDNRLFLDQFSPLLIGKSLRNYLAHGDVLVDVFPFDPSTALVLNAFKMSEAGTDLITNKNILIGNKILANPSECNRRYSRRLKRMKAQRGMFTAAMRGSIEAVEECIANGADVNARDVDGMTALHYAAAGDNIDVMLFLLDNNLSLTATRGTSQSLLHIASEYGSEKVVEYLLEQTLIPVDVTEQHGLTPLLFAASGGHADVVDTLLQYGANIEASDQYNMTSLHHSARTGQIDVVRVLLQNNADINAICDQGLTALQYAMYNDHQDIIALLLEKGAAAVEKMDKNMPLLHFSLGNGFENAVRTLLENGANVNETNNCDLTPLHIAARFGQTDFVRDLLKRGANIDARCSGGMTPLSYAALFGQTEVAMILLDSGADPLSSTDNRTTSIHFASMVGQKNIVQLLIEKGADVDCVTKDGLTSLLFAASSGHTDVAMTLLERGADANISTSTDLAPIHGASGGGFKNIVMALLEKGANVNALDQNQVTPLQLAVLNNHTDITEVLLDRGADINNVAIDNSTPLMSACSRGNVDTVEMLLRRGAIIDALTGSMFAPLHMAAVKGHKNVVETLLRGGAAIDSLTEINWSALHYAASNGRLGVVKYLLEMGSNINALTTDTGFTPLHLAAVSAHTDVVEALLAKGADIDVRSKDTCVTALHLATLSGNVSAVQILLQNGANVNSKKDEGSSPLHLASTKDNKDIVEVLLNWGAELNARTECGFTALHVSSGLDRNDIVASLLNRGADVNQVDNLNRTPLLLAATNNHRDVVETLLNGGANVDSFDNNCTTALHASYDKPHIVDLLLKHNADVNTVDKHYFTALHYASRDGHTCVVDTLIQNGSDVGLRATNGMIALHLAAKNGNTDVVDVLLEHKANVNSVDGHSCTPLMYAASNGHQQTVARLLESDADIDVPDTDGMTALHLAAHRGHVGIVTVLLEKGADFNLLDKNAWTLLQHCANDGHTDVVTALLTAATSSGITDRSLLKHPVD